MNAKTKEKKTIMNALLGGEADILVVDPIRYRQMADIKNKEFYEVEKDKECKEEKKVPGLTDAELLCCDIAIHIAHKTAARFEDMADGMEMSTLKQIVRRIEDADPESVVPMLQTMFLARGMVDIAEDLDMLELCSKYDEDTFFVFYDILFDTDIFDWFSIENMFDDFHSEDELITNERKEFIWQTRMILLLRSWSISELSIPLITEKKSGPRRSTWSHGTAASRKSM